MRQRTDELDPNECRINSGDALGQFAVHLDSWRDPLLQINRVPQPSRTLVLILVRSEAILKEGERISVTLKYAISDKQNTVPII